MKPTDDYCSRSHPLVIGRRKGNHLKNYIMRKIITAFLIIVFSLMINNVFGQPSPPQNHGSIPIYREPFRYCPQRSTRSCGTSPGAGRCPQGKDRQDASALHAPPELRHGLHLNRTIHPECSDPF